MVLVTVGAARLEGETKRMMMRRRVKDERD